MDSKIIHKSNNFLNLLIAISMVMLTLFLILNVKYPKTELQTDQINACEVSKHQISNIRGFVFDFEEINILTNPANLKCLSKIAWIQIQDDGLNKIFVSSSLDVYRSVSYIFNAAFSLLALFYIKQLKQKLLIAYFTLNVMLIFLLVSYEPLWRIFFPFNLPNNKQNLFWGMFLFLYVYLKKIKSKYLMWIFICFAIIMETNLISIFLLIFYIFEHRDNQV